MKTRLALSLSVLLAAPALHAADAHDLQLQGTIGKYPVVMEVDGAPGADVSGAYFYRRFRQDIPLRGTRTDSALTLSADNTGDRFALTQTGDGYSGSFTSAKGAKLPVELHPVPSGSVAMPAGLSNPDRSWSDYDKLKLADMRFVPGKKETVDGRYTIQWSTEPLSGFSMFHVLDGYPQPVLAAINRVIDRDVYANLGNYFSCSGDNGKSGIDSLNVPTHYLSDRFVSYSISSSWFCTGAAHPDFGTSGTTIDAKTGKELQLDDVLRFGSGTQAKPKPNSDAWYTYRDKVFAPGVVAMLSRLYPAQMKKPGNDDDCDYTDPQIWAFGPWYLTSRGMYIGAGFARVQRACDNPDWSVIPYSVLRTKNPAMFAN